MFALLQDWTEIEGVGAVTFTQSGARWLTLDGFQDVVFYLEVRLKEIAELLLDYDTAPSLDPTLFQSMATVPMHVSTTPAVTRVLLSMNPSVPLAGLVRWRITSLTANDPWRVNFRITCVAKRGP